MLIRTPLRAVALAASLVLALGSCRDHPVGPQPPRIVSLGLAPRFAVSAGTNDLPVNRIRLRATEEGTGVVLGALETAVDPTAQSWPLTLEVTLEGGRSTSVIVTIELLHDGGTSSTPSVEWSGRTSPIAVSPGSSSDVANVTLGRGSLDNLSITAVAIGGQPPTLVEGDSVTLGATATGATGTPQFYWNSLDQAVATVDVAGKVRTLRDGTARIVVAAGTQADTMVVTATQRVATITMSADTLWLTAIGATGTLTATPLDPRGATVTGATIQWTIATPGVATHLGGGLFRADSNGATPVTATVAGFTAQGKAVVSVIQRAASLDITPTTVTLNGAGATATIPYTMLDANGNPVTTVAPAWTSRNTAIATVSSAGVVTGVAQGATRVVATAGSVSDSVDVTVGAGAAASVAAYAGNNQTATVNSAVAVAPAVRVLDASGSPVPGVAVAFAVTAGGGRLVGPATATTDSIGVATSGGWVLGSTAGANGFTATVTGLPAVVFTATGTAGAPATIVASSGNNQTGTAGTALSQPLVVLVTDAFANPVSGALVTWTPSAGSVNPATGNTGANGTAQTVWTPGFGSTSQSLTATVGALTPATFAANVTQPAPSVRLALDTVDKVSVGRQATIGVTLTQPAPAGGTTVTVSSGTPTVLGMITGATTIPQGGTAGAVTVSGVSEGTSLVSATAAGYDPGSLSVAVELRLIGMQPTFSVPFGQSASIPITLARPAPAGGIVLSVVSSDPATVGVASATYTIPAGSQSVNAVLNGIQPGTARVVASHPFYDPDTVLVTSAASLNVTAGGLSLDQSFGTSMTIRFESNGTPVPAPSPGVTIALSAADPGCVNVPASATIATGLVDVTVPVSYGGTTATTCNTIVRATATNITPDSVSASVAPVPPITVSDQFLGRGLQKQVYGYLGASNHPADTVRLQSLDSSRVILSADPAVAGSGTLRVAVPAGGTYFYYHLQAVEGTTAPDSVLVVATTSDGKFRPDTGVVHLLQPVVDLQGVPRNTTSLAADNVLYARVGIAQPGYNYMTEGQSVRAGAPALTVTFHVADSTIASLITNGVADSVRTAQIAANAYNTPTSIASGAVSLHPHGNGTTVVSVSAPGYAILPQSADTVTVTTPTITVGTRYVGAGLQIQHYGYLDSPAPAGGTVVRLVSTDSGRVQLAPSDTAQGTGTVLITVPAGQSYFYFYLQGVEGQSAADVTVNVSAAQFASTTFTAGMLAPVFSLQGVPTTTTTLSPSNAIYVQVGIAQPGYNYMTEAQVVRAHGVPLTATLTANHPEVGAFFPATDTTARNATVQLTVPVRSYYSPTSIASGGAGFRPIAAGGDTITATLPGFVGIGGGDVRIVTVSAPTITIPQFAVGSGLMRQSYLYLETGNHNGTTVWIKSTDSTRLKISPDANTVGSDSIAVAVPIGQTYVYFYAHGMEGQTGTPSVVAGAPLFRTDTSAQSVVQPRFSVNGLNQNIRTLDPDNPFYVQVGLDTYGYGYTTEPQAVRAGAAPLTVTIFDLNTGVGFLKTSRDSAAAQVTVQILAGQSNSPSSVAAGGVAFDPQTSGTTEIRTRIPGFMSARIKADTVDTLVVNVTAPPIYVNNVTVGAGLQQQGYLTLGSPAPVGLRLVLKSSQPSVALVSPNDVNVAGTDSVAIDVPQGTTYVYFYVHGVEGQTGTVTITASAPGYGDGTGTATIVQPYVAFYGIGTTMAAGSADQSFYAVVGPLNYYGSGVDGQVRRAGQPPLVVTVTNANDAIGTLVDTLGAVSSPRTLGIAPGLYYTPTSVASGGLAFRPLAAGTTTVSVSIPGFQQVTDPNSGATRVVTVTPPPTPAVGGTP